MSCNKVLIVAAIAVACVIIYKKVKKSEPYQDVFMAKDIPNDEFISRPSFSAQLAPRMDPFRNGGYDKLNGYLPNVEMQATPINPLSNGSFPIDGNKVDYASLGTSSEIAQANEDCAMAKLKKFDSLNNSNNNSNNNIPQARTSEKFAMNFSGSNAPPMAAMQTQGLRKTSSMGNNDLEYLSPKDLLPTPDMESVLDKDPTDANVFMYDRTLFSPLKRRNLNNVDFIRGDLPIKQVKNGWFDSTANPGTDLMIGAVNIIAPSMEERTEMQDLVYTRYDHSYPLQADATFGDLPNRFM